MSNPLRNGKLLAPPSMGQPTMAIASPLNDIQMICLMAADLYPHCGSDPKLAVGQAMEIMAESIMEMQAGRLSEIAARKKAAEVHAA